jgi:protein-tyrosine phosphatase
LYFNVNLQFSRQGKSRSATFIAAYLVAKCDMSLAAALDLITHKNDGHKINDGFLRQLMHWECQVRNLPQSSLHNIYHTRNN